jgi:hypothetical protein
MKNTLRVDPEQTSTRTGKWLLTKREIAPILSVSQRTIDNWMAGNRTPYFRMIRFDLQRVQDAVMRYEIREVGRCF